MPVYVNGKLFKLLPHQQVDPSFTKEQASQWAAKQLLAVFTLMQDGKWRTIRQMSEALGIPESSVGSRIRDLRLKSFGGHSILKSHLGKRVFQYKLKKG